jgi:hypothetical protein
VTIDGANFGAVQGTVDFDATPANVITWTDTSIQVDAPGGSYGLVTVTVAAGTPCSLPGTYDYDDVGPIAPDIDPVSGEYCVGDSITVTPNESGGSLHCTTDNSDPDCASPSPPPTIPSGGFTLRCVQCDDCNNEGDEASEVYTTDEVANVDITTPPDGETVSAGNLLVTGTADGDIPTVTVTSNQGHNESPSVSGGSWSVTLASVAAPSITYTATGSDECGNVGSDTHTNPVSDCGCGDVVGDGVVIDALPRYDAATELPPTSVTQNMPVSSSDVYLKFIYDQSIVITGASENLGGTLALETTNCGDDTLAWYGPSLSYETDYNLQITGVTACDDGASVPAINLDLRTARDVVAGNQRAETGEGFIDGSLQITVVDDIDETVIYDAVVQINTPVQHDDPGWARELGETSSGSVSFAGAVVPLNQPVTITAMAPGYQYLTFYEQDAREVVLGLRLRGEGFTSGQLTNIIGDFNPSGFNTGVHPAHERPSTVFNPQRTGLASLGFHKRTMSTLELLDILSPDVQVQLYVIDRYMNEVLPGNMFLPDWVTDRGDMPTASPAFVADSFYRVLTYRTGAMWLAVTGASINFQGVDLDELAAGTAETLDILANSPITPSCADIQRIDVPSVGSCCTLVVDTSTRSVSSDPLTGCTTIRDDGRRMVLDNYTYGWSGQGGSGTDIYRESGFDFDRAIRLNMSNWPYDPDESEYYDARVNNYHGQWMVPGLQLVMLDMPDQTQLGIGLALTNYVDLDGAGSGIDVSTKLFGLPDVGDIESDLGVSGIEVGIVTTAFDWEMRLVGMGGRNMDVLPPAQMPEGGCNVGPCYFKPAYEWIPWIYGMDPTDPGNPGRNEECNLPSSPTHDLNDRIFEVPELVYTDVRDIEGAGISDDLNSELVMMRLLDVDIDASRLEDSYKVRTQDKNGTLGWMNLENPVWRFYAPPKLVDGGSIITHLPTVPTVADINGLGLTGSNYTFEDVSQTGVPNGFDMQWANNAINLPTGATMNNLVERDMMYYEVDEISQNAQYFIFQAN